MEKILFILLGFLLPWTWVISSRLLQQSIATAPYLGCGVAPFGDGNGAITHLEPDILELSEWDLRSSTTNKLIN